MIEEMQRKDTAEIAGLHYLVLKEELLSKFGRGFLKTLYDGLLDNKAACGFIYRKCIHLRMVGEDTISTVTAPYDRTQ